MFVACIRRFAVHMDIAEAVEEAVRECIRSNILSDFLAAQRAEVIAMSIFEYNEAEEMKKIRAAEFSVGKAAGKAEAVLEVLEELGDIPQVLRTKVLAETDLIILKKWFKAALKAETIQMFMEQTGLR